ncbi:hypothetical protein JG687_00016700 [Phytophthora cactorum]|uniref:Uncharacterized protein n=1 Tax=Phytophthora cactorum TaxID=29920 RepID=A0A8T1TUF1_9STRA|nr:hypothetical protein JG687_00016700 [Phytophthora cactorum]
MATTKTQLSFEGERELVTEARAHELVQTYADAEAQPPAFTHITLRNKSYTIEAARVIATFFSRLEARGAFAQLTSVDFADMIAGRPEDEALQVLATLCDALSAIKTLTRIDLSDNALGEKGVRACFGLLQEQEQLQHMYFCNNGISAAAAGVIAQEVLLFRGQDTPTKLETFHFYNNMSGDGGAIALAKLLPLSPALKDLRFSATRAQREGSLTFAKALASLKKLEKLDLSDNTFKAQGGEAIAAAVKNMPNLVEVNLRDAAIEDDGLVAIAGALREGGAAKALTTLDVSGNDLTAEGMLALGQMLRESAVLRVLQVEENEIGSKGAKIIAKALKVGSPALEKVVANVNEIGASGALALVKAVVDKKAFVKLDIDGNQISADGVASIESLLESKNKDTNSDAAAPVVVTTLPSMNPPLFFEIVEDLVYRSNKCDATSFPFLATLQLNTVVYLSYDDLSRDLAAFFAEKEINVIHLGMKYRTASSQWKGISEGMAKETIEYILDQRRHPILVMCKTGVHFAGTMIGCLRRLQNWSLTSTIDKYRNIAGSVKTRFENEQFIELFDVDLVTLPQQLPSWFTVHQQLTEEERIALTRGEFFPGRTLAIVEEQPKKEPPQLDAKTENEVRPEIEEVPAEATETPVLAYQKYFFYLQGPLVSSSVKFSEKKSIIGDDDDD